MSQPTVSFKTPKDVLDYLIATFPAESPRLSWTDREVWWKGGQHDVATHLQTVMDERGALLAPVLSDGPSSSVPRKQTKDSKSRARAGSRAPSD